MQHIKAKPKNISELLNGKKYTLEYFQREYNWEKNHMEDLINDLLDEFEKNYDDDSENDISKFSYYFLGSIIVNKREQGLSLIDGQQRLTSLSLILIWISRKLPEIKESILSLIYSDEGSERIYALHAKERVEAMGCLCGNKKITNSENLSSIQNISENFDIIENIIPEYNNEKLKTFANWLKNKVFVARIIITSEKDGYKIFESSNDRGLELKSSEMLKSYLLSKIKGDEKRMDLNDMWKDKIDEIIAAGEPDSENAIKSWLRATKSESQADFDDIGSKFDHWIENKKDLGISSSADFENFIEHNFFPYMDWYILLKNMALHHNPDHEAVRCNEHWNFTLQYPVILSAISLNDSRDTIFKKINVVATFLDIFVARHLWRRQTDAIGQRKAKFAMHELIKKIRKKELNDIVEILQDETEKFPLFKSLDLPENDKVKRYFLARFSAWLDAKIDKERGNLPIYLNPQEYHIEHVLADKFERYEDIKNEDDKFEFEDENDFQQHRNRFGALLLLRGPNNQKYSDAPYEKKLEWYFGQNMILPKTLHKVAYKAIKELDDVKADYGISFESHDDKFLKAEIKQRNQVYKELAEVIWDPDRIKQAAE